MSSGGTASSVAELDAFAENPGTLYVIAAGNDGTDNDLSPHYPCDYEPGSAPIAEAVENIVCVAATNQADGLASFSDWGPTNVDLGAPGTEIISTYPVLEDELGENFETDDFEAKWMAVEGHGFARTNEAPLTSYGMSDTPGAAAAANSVHDSILTPGIEIPAGAGGCQLSGRRFVSLGGGTLIQTVYSEGVAVFVSQPPNSGGSTLVNFSTVPIAELAGTTVRIRYRFTAGAAPSAANGVWLDDLSFSCYAPLSTPPTDAFLQGTSMAAPQVSGTAALLFSQKPSATVAEARSALISSAAPDPALAGKTVSGGRLDAAAALETLSPPPSEPGPPSEVVPTAPGEAITITSPTHEGPPASTPPAATPEATPARSGCTVPHVAGKKLARAKALLAGAGCRVGKVSRSALRKHGGGAAALVVRSTSPGAGAHAATGVVDVTLAPKPVKRHH